MLRVILKAILATVVSGLSRAAPLNTFVLNTGAAMPALGFGTYQLDGEELRDALRCAIAAGYRHIDTAAGYENEHVVAAAIAESGLPRDDFFLTSKLWCTDHGDDDAFDAILSSLAQLDTEYLDLYLIHAPNNLGASDEDKVELRRQSWAAMSAMHEAGCLLCRQSTVQQCPGASALYVRATCTGLLVLYAPEAQGTMPLRATHCAHAVHVPASPRTVAPQALP